jgi:phosphonate metabolism protein (transferase hexapeptide repeat family)
MLHYFDFYPKQPELVQKFGQKQLGPEPYFHEHVLVHDSHVGSWTEIGANTHLSEATFDDYSYAAGDASIIYADVGRFCSIASHVRINPGNHPMWRVTQHHMTYRRKQYGFGDDDHEFFEWRREHRCTIGHDVWIGHGAIIMPGIKVGTGAVVGSGAVVTKDVPPYTIVVGVAAHPVRQRFPDNVIEKLLAIAWWDWDHETIKARFDDLLDMDQFIGKYG